MQNQSYTANIKLKREILRLVVEMGFFDEMDDSMTVNAFIQLLDRIDCDIFLSRASSVLDPKYRTSSPPEYS